MKKTIALVLSLIMMLGAVCALGEETAKTEMGTLNVGQVFRIQSRIPDGYVYKPIKKTELNLVGLLSAGEDKPTVTVSIAYNEEYADVERFNDVDESVVEEIRKSFRAADDNIRFEDLETAYGTRLLKVTDDTFVDIYTIYKGYELEFVMTGNGRTDEAVQMLVDYISEMDFVAVE